MVDKFGNKTGGRKAGTPNKIPGKTSRIITEVVDKTTQTLQQQSERAGEGQVLVEPQLVPQARATSVLAALMVTAQAEFERWHKSKAKGARERALAWFDRCAFVGSKLAPFQSPTFKALAIAAPPPLPQRQNSQGEPVQEVTLRVFEAGRRPVPLPAPEKPEKAA